MDVAKLKWKNRAKDSALSTIKALLPPLVNLVVAYIVIQANGQESWGAFVEVLIFVSLTATLLSFGVKDYVLREASLKPHHLYALTKSALATRLLLLFVGIGAAFLFFNYHTAFWLAIWLSAQWIYTGIDPLINFEKKYWIATLAEFIGGLGLVSYLLFISAETPNLIAAFAVTALVKSVVVSVFFGRKLKQEKASISLQILVASFPFMLLGASGMLQSKTDLYLVAALLKDGELAKYQVTSSFLLYLQAFAAFALLPFAKNLYRLPKRTIFSISLKLGLTGLFVCCISMPALYWILNSLYEFHLSATIVVIGGLYILPSWFFIPLVYKIIGCRNEQFIVGSNIIGIAINLALTYTLILSFELTGAFIGSAITQWVLLAVYIVFFVKSVTLVE